MKSFQYLYMPVPEIMKTQVMDMVCEQVSETFELEYILFEKGISPFEFKKQDDWHGVIEKSSSKLGRINVC